MGWPWRCLLAGAGAGPTRTLAGGTTLKGRPESDEGYGGHNGGSGLSISSMEHESTYETARWLLDDLADGARELGRPLSDDTLQLLASPIAAVMVEVDPEDGKHLNNDLVVLIRDVINLRLEADWKRRRKAQLRSSAGSMWRDEWFNYKAKRVRTGMRAPIGWLGRYEKLHETNADLFLSAVLQNVILGNPLAGETSPWRN